MEDDSKLIAIAIGIVFWAWLISQAIQYFGHI